MIGREWDLLIQNGFVHYLSEVRVGATNTYWFRVWLC